MLDLGFVRENLDAVRKAMADRSFPADVLDRFAEMDVERRRLIGQLAKLNEERNKLSKQIGELRKPRATTNIIEQIADAGLNAGLPVLGAQVKNVKRQIPEFEEYVRRAEADMDALLQGLPNIPAPDVPIGPDESANKEIRRWGAPREFDFEPKDHVDLGSDLGILDLERATKVTGSRFAILTGAGARLERALINFMLDAQREAGYTETLPPFLVNRDSLFGTGQLPKFADDLFFTNDERGLALIPTAEVPVTNYYRDEILDAGDLPKHFVAYTPCFRSEAGSYGRDTRGLIRQHQFEKVELVKITTPETSEDEHEKLTADAERILQLLGLPYRTMVLSTGDMGFSARKTYDIEVWLPSQKTYREISSCSNCGDFQARRMNTRFRPAGGGKPQFVHTLNGSGLAVGRTWIAVMENYQQPDGSIAVPEILQQYMGGHEVITS